jgi:hypothetical protein
MMSDSHYQDNPDTVEGTPLPPRDTEQSIRLYYS